jgi:hypothetical protein
MMALMSRWSIARPILPAPVPSDATRGRRLPPPRSPLAERPAGAPCWWYRLPASLLARRGYQGTLAILLIAVVACAVVPGAASAGLPRAASAPANRAAVHAYLLDMHAYAQAVAKAAPAVVGTYEGAANRIAGECPGAFVGAPQEANVIELGPSILRRTARQRGEEKRQSTQLSDMEEELSSELAFAEQEPRHTAVTALLANLKALPQDDPALSQLVHADTIGLEEELQAESTNVCADMKAWAGSGYRMLSQSSRTLALKHETELASFLRDLPAQFAASEPTSLTETPADRALVHETSQLESQTARTIANPIKSARKRVEAALGLTARAKREERLKSTPPESKFSTELGAGRTAAGSRYTVWLERTKGGYAGTCKLRMEVRGAEGAKPGLLRLIEGESGLCLKPRGDSSKEPSIKCSKGILKIDAAVLPTTRTVDLRLSNGAQIVSRPVLVPRRLGGPDAFYYQAVRGPSPIPVSLIERDARGHTLGVLKLRRIVGCSEHPLKYLPGGKRALVHGSTPQGPDFSIVGERYRLFGRVHIQLKLSIGEGLVGSSSEDEEEHFDEGRYGSVAVPMKRPAPLDSEISAACYPHEYSIFYGLLEQPRDTVLAKIAGKLVPALHVRIPGSLKTAPHRPSKVAKPAKANRKDPLARPRASCVVAVKRAGSCWTADTAEGPP